MKTRTMALCLIGTWLAAPALNLAADMGTAFTYQGRLVKTGMPVTSSAPHCDFTFGLFDVPAGGSPVVGTSPASLPGVAVINGLFTVNIDFGPDAINGHARWLEITVDCPDDPMPTTLIPRQELKPAPHALALPGLYTQQNATSANLIGGYSGNSVTPGAIGVTIAGGGRTDDGFFPADNNRVTDDFGTIGGGQGNQAGDGDGNTGGRPWTTVGGGFSNTASGLDGTVGGGNRNMASGNGSTVGGGALNTASGSSSNVGGGDNNSASGSDSTVGGGSGNIASGGGATVGGGGSNVASGIYSTVGGGANNQAGGDYSFAAGNQAKANHEGTFVWSDLSPLNVLTSTGPNQFRIRASGGTNIYSNSTATVGVQLAPGGNSWSALSDRDAKENFTTIDPRETIQRLTDIPITIWNLKSQDPSIRHLGPMAQDFYAAFGLGENDTHISTSDADGVALAAIQGLHQIVQEKDCEIGELQQHNQDLKRRLDRIEAILAVSLSGKEE